MHAKDTPGLGLHARLWLYSVNLVFAIGDLIVGIMGAIVGLRYAFNENSVPFSIVSLVLAAFTTALCIILLIFCNRPTSTHVFSRVKFHSYSLAIAGVLRLALGIMFITTAPANCNFKDPSDGLAYLWCGWSISEAVIGFVWAGLLLVPAWLLYAPARSKDYTMDMNIASE